MNDAPRTVVIDPGLRAENGHHGSFARLLGDEVRRRGASAAEQAITLVGHAEVRPELSRDLAVLPHFNCSTYDRLPHETDDAAMIERELHRLDSAVWKDAELIVFPTVAQHQLAGTARWLRHVIENSEAAAVLVLLFPPGEGPVSAGQAEDDAAFRSGFALLETLSADRVSIIVENRAMADVFSAYTRLRINIVPWPALRSEHAAPRAAKRNAAMIGYLGYAKEERGVHLLPDIARGVLAARPDARFFIQINTYLPRPLQTIIESLQALAPALTLHRGPLSAAAYRRTMERLGLLLLPYDPRAYAMRGSGVFSEAAALACPVVATRNTSIAEDMARGTFGGLIADSFTAEAFIRASVDGLCRHAELARQAMDAAANWRRERTIDAWLDRVIDLTGSAQRILQPVSDR